MNKRQVGTDYEERAVAFLQAGGMRVVERNFRNRRGEIDVIGYHKDCLVFVEVKYRKSTFAGYAVEAVDYNKQRQICKTADFYRVIHRIPVSRNVRYDVVAIQGNEIEWMQNAFPHRY